VKWYSGRQQQVDMTPGSTRTPDRKPGFPQVIHQSQPDLSTSWDAVDTTGLTQAELAHHCWYLFRHQIGALKDELAEVRRDIASIQVSAKSDIEVPTTIVSQDIEKVRDAIQIADKAWRQEVARLSTEIQTNRAEAEARIAEVQPQIATIDTVEKIKAELVTVAHEQTQHALRLAAFEEGARTYEKSLDTLRVHFDEAICEHRANSAELRESLSKSWSKLSLGLQADMAQSGNKNFVHIENEVARLQATFEADHQSLRNELEDNIQEQTYKIKDNHSAIVDSIRVLDAKLRNIIAEESEKNDRQVSELGSSFRGNFDALKTNAEESLTHVENLIADVSQKHQRNLTSVHDMLSDLENIVKIGSSEVAVVRDHVNQIRSVPLIRGALSQCA
jgi:ribosomal protein L29